jgi:hypothetical protein
MLAHLVLRADAHDIQRFRQLVQAAVQVVTKLHEVLDVEDLREEQLQGRQAGTAGRQGRA